MRALFCTVLWLIGLLLKLFYFHYRSFQLGEQAEQKIRMLNKNIQKIKLRKNKRVKDEKKAAEKERKLPRNR